VNKRDEVRKTVVSDLTAESDGLVVCLSGPWGCGKTHLWDEVAAELRAQGKTVAKVSLFGMTSVQDAKSSIINELVLGATNEGDGSVKNGLAFAKGWLAKQAPLLMKLADGKIGVELLTKNLDLTRWIARGSILCLDDLERISPQFALADALGLANLLAEERGCRVLLIMNEGHLDERFSESEAKTLRSYRERIARRFLLLEPDLAAVVPPLMKSRHLDLTAEIVTPVLETAVRAQCTNIRSLLRALEHSRDLLRAAQGRPPTEDLRFVAALTLEHAAGDLKPAEFYNFHPLKFLFSGGRSGKTERDPMTELQESFYARYFGANDYVFSAELYGLVAHGYFNATAYRDSVAMRTSPPPTSLGRLMANMGALQHAYLSDEEATTWIAEALTALGEGTTITAHQVGALAATAHFLASELQTPLGATFLSKAEEALRAAARRGDRSLERVVYAGALPGDLILAFEDECTRSDEASAEQDMFAAMEARDRAKFTSLIQSRAAQSADLVFQPRICAKWEESRKVDRRFYFLVIEHLKEIAKQGLADTLGETLRAHLVGVLALPTLDKTDASRISRSVAELEHVAAARQGHARPPRTSPPVPQA
jgi:hypothetical protein